MGLGQKYIMENKKQELEEAIEYFNDYKKNLIQFLIHSTAYPGNKKTWGRVRLNPAEILNIQKEISRMDLFIYDLKLIKNPNISVLNYLNNKHLNKF